MFVSHDVLSVAIEKPHSDILPRSIYKLLAQMHDKKEVYKEMKLKEKKRMKRRRR